MDAESSKAHRRTPLHFAARAGDADLTSTLLLEKRISPNSVDINGTVPLHLAAYGDHCAVANQLILHGADVNRKGRQGESALSIAVICGHDAMAELLLKRGADPNLPDDHFGPLLLMAVKLGCKPVVRVLVARGANVDGVGPTGTSAAHLAARHGDADILTELISAGANLELGDADGFRPLHEAAAWGRACTTRELLKAGADVHSKDKFGDTPLHKCIEFSPFTDPDGPSRFPGLRYQRYYSTIMLLLATGSNVFALNNNGQCALALATLANSNSLVDILKAHVDSVTSAYEVRVKAMCSIVTACRCASPPALHALHVDLVPLVCGFVASHWPLVPPFPTP